MDGWCTTHFGQRDCPSNHYKAYCRCQTLIRETNVKIKKLKIKAKTKKQTRKSKQNIKSLYNERDELRTYIGTLKQVSTMSNDDESLNAIQGYEDSEDVFSKISIIKTDFGTE